MDLAKALAMMGFGTARIVDPSGERDAQSELNNALTRQMEAFEKKKKKTIEVEKSEERKKVLADKMRDDIRTMHEAYQFLAKKYYSDKDRLKEKQMRVSEGQPEDGFGFDAKEEDEVFGINTAVKVKTATNIFKEKAAARNENENNNNVAEDDTEATGTTRASCGD